MTYFKGKELQQNANRSFIQLPQIQTTHMYHINIIDYYNCYIYILADKQLKDVRNSISSVRFSLNQPTLVCIAKINFPKKSESM